MIFTQYILLDNIMLFVLNPSKVLFIIYVHVLEINESFVFGVLFISRLKNQFYFSGKIVFFYNRTVDFVCIIFLVIYLNH